MDTDEKEVLCSKIPMTPIPTGKANSKKNMKSQKAQ